MPTRPRPPGRGSDAAELHAADSRLAAVAMVDAELVDQVVLARARSRQSSTAAAADPGLHQLVTKTNAPPAEISAAMVDQLVIETNLHPAVPARRDRSRPTVAADRRRTRRRRRAMKLTTEISLFCLT